MAQKSGISNKSKEGRIVFSDEKKVVGKQFPVEEDLQKALKGEIWITVLMSLGVLYFVLLGVMRHAARTIEAQGGEITSLSRQLDEKLRWQEKSYVGTIKALMSVLNAKDHYAAGHCLRVKGFAEAIGGAMGLGKEQLRVLQEACLFHDIGKIGIPEAILNKPALLNIEEYERIKSHAGIGAEIIDSIHYLNEHAKIIRHHHERVDGRGYPEGLAGEDIPLKSRILAVADTFDALTSDHPYRKGRSQNAALTMLEELKGTQLDLQVVDIFIEIMKYKSAGNQEEGLDLDAAG